MVPVLSSLSTFWSHVQMGGGGFSAPVCVGCNPPSSLRHSSNAPNPPPALLPQGSALFFQQMELSSHPKPLAASWPCPNSPLHLECTFHIYTCPYPLPRSFLKLYPSHESRSDHSSSPFTWLMSHGVSHGRIELWPAMTEALSGFYCPLGWAKSPASNP